MRRRTYMHSDLYRLNEKKIFIYGAGEMGRNVKNTIESAGLEVEAFIDRRAGDYNLFHSKRVYTVDELERYFHKDRLVIILAFKNVYQHDEVARKLQKKGFYNIIFKPRLVLYGNTSTDSEILEKINNIHSTLTDGHAFWENDIPSLKNTRLNVHKKVEIIKSYADEVVFWAPAEMLFMNDNEDYGILQGKNIMAVYSAIPMYEGFRNALSSNSTEGINQYIKQVAMRGAIAAKTEVTDNWKKNLIEGRKAIYDEMKKQLVFNPNFFVDHCVKVRLRKSMGFQIVSSGKNRVSFLIAEGYNYVPVRISKTDYNKYLNSEVADNIIENIEGPIFAPIPHPFFYYIQAECSDYVGIWLYRIAKKIADFVYEIYGNYEFSTIKILDMLDDNGVAGRYLKSIGCDVERYVDTRLCRQLDSLFNMNMELYHPSNSNQYEILLLSSRCNSYFSANCIDLIDKWCFFLQWDNEDVMIQHILSNGFEQQESIFATYCSGVEVAGFIFRRVDY